MNNTENATEPLTSSDGLGGWEPGRLMHEECTCLDDFWHLMDKSEKAIWADRERRVREPLVNLLAHWMSAAEIRDPLGGRLGREQKFMELKAITEKVVNPPNSALSQGGPATHNTKPEPEPPLAPANG